VSLIPETAGDVEPLQALWLAFTGRLFSPLDVNQLSRWQDRGVPYEVVAAGIREAYRAKAYRCRPGELPLRARVRLQ
jgi:hypothetical protein